MLLQGYEAKWERKLASATVQVRALLITTAQCLLTREHPIGYRLLFQDMPRVSGACQALSRSSSPDPRSCIMTEFFGGHLASIVRENASTSLHRAPAAHCAAMQPVQ